MKEELVLRDFFFNVLTSTQNATVIHDVIHNGCFLMELVAGSDIASFGRRLCFKLFSSEDRDQLV